MPGEAGWNQAHLSPDFVINSTIFNENNFELQASKMRGQQPGAHHVPPHLTVSHHIPPYPTSSHHVLPYPTASPHIPLCPTMSTTSHYIPPCSTASYQSPSHHTASTTSQHIPWHPSCPPHPPCPTIRVSNSVEFHFLCLSFGSVWEHSTQNTAWNNPLLWEEKSRFVLNWARSSSWL